MSRLEVKTPSKAQEIVEQLYRNMERRISASPPGLCPGGHGAEFSESLSGPDLRQVRSCRIGLTQLSGMIRNVLDGETDIKILQRIETTARVIRGNGGLRHRH